MFTVKKLNLRYNIRLNMAALKQDYKMDVQGMSGYLRLLPEMGQMRLNKGS